MHQRLKIQEEHALGPEGKEMVNSATRDQGKEGEDVVELCPKWMIDDI